MADIIIPIDASQIAAGDRGQQSVKVAVMTAGKVVSQVVALKAAKAEVKLKVDAKVPITVAVGPSSASNEDLFHLQTLTASVAPKQWLNKAALTLKPFVITPVWWRMWLMWCRNYTIQGRLVCADGSPVPGAEVHAYDVDFFWWWSSVQQVGPTAVTDANGQFTISFRWCCGWLPWWWWRLRQWRLDQVLIDKIHPVLQLNPGIKFPDPSPVISFDMAQLNVRPTAPDGGKTGPNPVPSPPALKSNIVDPTTIPALRDKLTAILPHVPEFERLRIWPWWPWTPWLDCTPDIIFKVTQNCGGSETRVIVNENVFQTRWDIPTTLNVTLVANDQACCLPPHDQDPQGDCAVITGVCGDPGYIAGNIGGNSAHPGGPIGYVDPGGRDRPFAETISIFGLLGDGPQSDYYGIEFKADSAPATDWAPVPADALLGFTRGYFDSTQPWPNQWFYPGFGLTVGPQVLYESRHHYEDTHPAAWGNAFAGRSWFLNVNALAVIQTFGHFADGTYDFRVRGYRSLPAGGPDPNDPGVVLDGCGQHQDNNKLVLRIDNRIVGPHAPGTVHVNTTEPDCDITSVKIGGAEVGACGSHQLEQGAALDIDFTCTDPDGHLDHYELNVLWGLGEIRNLLSFGAAPTGDPGVQPGPDYSNAIAQGALRPSWVGGNMHLHIPNAAAVFPVTCCYLIELTVYKRNIANCDGHLNYYNQMHYSFTVNV